MEYITVTTKSGFTAEIDKEALDDIELLDDLERMDRGDYLAVSSVLRRLLGEKQKKALYDHVRGEDGRVSVTAVADEIVEIFGILSATEETKK